MFVGFNRGHLRDSLLVGIGIGVVLLLLLVSGTFRFLQLGMSNLYFIERPVSEQVVIVALDDDSLQRYGRSPAEWSREVYADLVTILSDAGVRVIAFDLLFSESAEGDRVFRDAIESARQSDSRTRVIGAVAGVRLATEQISSDLYPNAITYEEALLPIAELRDVFETIGFVNAFPDVDSQIRRQPSIVFYDDGVVGLTFSLAIYASYLRIPPLALPQVMTADRGTLQFTQERQLGVDDNGFWLQNYFSEPSSTISSVFDVISANDILDNRFDATQVADKIVMIGLYTVTGERDRYPVPSAFRGGLMQGVEIQANAVESLLQNTLPSELPLYGQVILLMCLSCFSSISTVRPTWTIKLLVLSLLVISFFVLAFVAFNVSFILLPLFYGMLALVLPPLIHIGLMTSREIFLRQQSDFLLASFVEISEQQLQISAILPSIQADVVRILPGSSGAIYLREQVHLPLICVHTWGWRDDVTVYDPLVKTMETQAKTVHAGMSLVVPIWWQGKTLGALAVTHVDAPRRQPFLENFSSQLAPTFDNTLLYQEVSRQRSMLSTVLGNTPSAVLVLDSGYRIQIYNDSAARLLRTDTIVGQSLLDILVQLEVEPEEHEELLKALQTQISFQMDVKIRDNSYQVDGALIPSLEQWVLVLTDITDLIELSNLKTRMLRMASHDLKNPLGRIMGYVQLLEYRPEDLSDKTKKYLSFINKSAEEMNSLIIDILDLERLRSGNLNKEIFDFRDIVRSVFSRHEPDATGKSQEYRLTLPDDVVILDGDVRQISQVVSNLIGNAIKYTPEHGTIVVNLSVVGTQTTFSVKDTGYGIPKAAQDQLFTEFYRVRTRETAQITGTGLGLSLVKSVVDAHDGMVAVESEEGKGSLFTVTLPTAGGSDAD